MTKNKLKESDYRKKVIEQILSIRDSGATNMFDAPTVQRLADELEYYELVGFITTHRPEYFNFILTGNEDLISS